MHKPFQRTAVGIAHSKLILVGEHSVVYGKPAIALPFPILEAKSTVIQSPGMMEIECTYYSGPLSNVPQKMAGIAACVKETLNSLNEPMEGLLIQLHSMIPVGRGLGSSASTAIAIVKSLYKYFEQELANEKLLELVHIAEKHAHGNPSGIDMVAASSELPIWFQKETKTTTLTIKLPFSLVVADTGRIGDTRLAVESIRSRYESNPEKTMQSIDLLGLYTYKAKGALCNGDIRLLGELLNLAQNELVKLGVSDEGIDHLVDVARKAGALGAKLTGGGRGGCVLALAKNMEDARMIADRLLEAGATQAWAFNASENKLY